MSRMPVYNQEDWLAGSIQQSAQKLNEQIPIETTIEHHEPQLPLAIDHRNDIQPKAGPGSGHHRSLASNAPRCTGMIVGPNTGFISKVDCCPNVLCFLTDAGKSLFQPLL